jgi:hypothetical protein
LRTVGRLREPLCDIRRKPRDDFDCRHQVPEKWAQMRDLILNESISYNTTINSTAQQATLSRSGIASIRWKQSRLTSKTERFNLLLARIGECVYSGLVRPPIAAAAERRS